MTYFDKSKTFEGKLNKRGKINKAWKERWFVLDEFEQTLEYYQTKQDAIKHSNLCGSIDISLILRIEVISHSQRRLLSKNKTILSKFLIENDKIKSNQPYSFQLVISNRTFIFSALESKTYIGWLHELTRVIYGGIVYEGWLHKMGHKYKSWKKRYFTLNRYKQMKYYVDADRKELVGMIDLNHCILITSGKSYGLNLKYSLEIQTPARTWIIVAETKEEKNHWLNHIKGVRWERMDEKTTNQCIRDNLLRHHADDLQGLQRDKQNESGPSKTNGIFNSEDPTHDPMYLLQHQMMMNNMMIANHLKAINNSMSTKHMAWRQQMMDMGSATSLKSMDPSSASNNKAWLLSSVPNNSGHGLYPSDPETASEVQSNRSVLSSPSYDVRRSKSDDSRHNQHHHQYASSDPVSPHDDLQEMYQQQQIEAMRTTELFVSSAPIADAVDDEKQMHNASAFELAMNKPLALQRKDSHPDLPAERADSDDLFDLQQSGSKGDCWDQSLIGLCSKRVEMRKQNKIARATASNEGKWLNLWSTNITENQVQYHWKIKIHRLDEENANGGILIGIQDVIDLDAFVKGSNENSFASSQHGYGVNRKGILMNGGKSGGKYSNQFQSGDCIDIFFDMKQFVMWYGVNGTEFGVACKVHQSFYKCAVAVYGSKHCVELLSCDTYCYPE